MRSDPNHAPHDPCVAKDRSALRESATAYPRGQASARGSSRSRKGTGTERGARKKAVTQFSSCPVNRNALEWYRWTILLLSVATRGNGALVAPGSVRAAGDLRKWLTCYRLRTVYALWQVWPDWELEIARIGRSLWFT
jgi:hypothetical protein